MLFYIIELNETSNVINSYDDLEYAVISFVIIIIVVHYSHNFFFAVDIY